MRAMSSRSAQKMSKEIRRTKGMRVRTLYDLRLEIQVQIK